MVEEGERNPVSLPRRISNWVTYFRSTPVLLSHPSFATLQVEQISRDKIVTIRFQFFFCRSTLRLSMTMATGNE
jgi:hypothetical protein